MPRVAICSLVRNGITYLPSFRRQLESLALDEDSSWHLYCLEGDSTDESWAFLRAWAEADQRVTVHQKHVGGATSKADLAKNWASVANSCFDSIASDSDHTHVLWLESDLCFPPEIVRRLAAHNADVVAPVIYLAGLFYDTWGFRSLDGASWNNRAPYHKDFRAFSLLPMQSVGSCVLFKRKILDAGIRMRGTYENGLLVGMCNDAREQGMKVWADTGTAILHPVDNWESQQWIVRSVTVHANGVDGAIEESGFAAQGIRRTLPVLDPEFLMRAHSRFIRDTFRVLNTNHVQIDVTTDQRAGRQYSMRLSPLAPSGAWSIPVLRAWTRLLTKLASRIRKEWQPVRIGEPNEPTLLACICSIQIQSPASVDM